MLKEIISHSEADTIAAAEALAEGLSGSHVIFLEGDLGAGKSVFARAFIRKRMNDPDLIVPSPTFTLLQHYQTPQGQIWHYDLYRLKDPEEMIELSWDDALSSGVVLVEWPERLGYLKPSGTTVSLTSVAGQENAREIKIYAA